MSLYPFYLPTPPPDVVSPELIADVDKAVWTAHVLMIASLSVGFWDWAVCLIAEYKQIWSKPFTLVTAIYLWTRYGFFISTAVALWVWLGGWDDATCEKRFLLAPGFMASVELAAMAVLFLRTWAVWRKAWYIAALCISLMVAYIGIQVYIERVHFTKVPIFRSQGPCLATGKPGTPAALYFAGPLIFDVIVTALLFIKLIPIARHTTMSDTLTRLFREGALYAALLSCINAANTAILQSKLLSNAFLVPVSFVLQACLTSRMILSLRASGESQESGLETRSFWSRVQKGSEINTYPGREAGQFSVNIHKVETTVVDSDGPQGQYELEEKHSIRGHV